MDGLAQPLPDSGSEAGGGYGLVRNPVPAGGGHLVQHWHSCLAPCPLGGHCLPWYTSQDLGLIGLSPTLSLYHGFFPAPPSSSSDVGAPRHPPLHRMPWPRAGRGDCGQAALPYWASSCPFVLGQAVLRGGLPGAVTVRRWLTKHGCAPNPGEP